MSATPATTAAAEAKPAAETDPWSAAVDRYRDVAKWVVASFGAIGALIAGTAPLTSIGSVASERLGAAVAGSVLGLLGVVGVIVAAVFVMVPRTVYGNEIAAKRQGWVERTFMGLGALEHLLATHPSDLLPLGFDRYDQLDPAIANLRRIAARAGPKAAEILKTLQAHERARSLVLRIARFEKARTRFHQCLLVMVIGGVATAAGIALLLYGLNAPPADPAEAEDTPGDPVPVTIALLPVGQETLRSRLGATCDLANMSALLLDGVRASGPWDVVTLAEAGCSSVRFVLTQDLGTIS